MTGRTGLEPATSVIAVFSDSKEGAMSLLDKARSSLAADGVALIGAAIVTLEATDSSVRLKIDPQVEGTTGDGAAVLDLLFPESVRSRPAVGRHADAAASYYRSIGAESNLLKEIGENLAPTGAALVVLVQERWLQEIEHALKGPGLSRFVLQPGALRTHGDDEVPP